MMKKIILATIICLFAPQLKAQDTLKLNKWLVSHPEKINLPAFAGTKNTEGNVFKDQELIEQVQINNTNQASQPNLVEIGPDSLISNLQEKYSLAQLTNYITVSRWTKGNINLTLNAYYKVYVDDILVKTKSSADLNKNTIELKLTTGKHKIQITLLTAGALTKINASFEYGEEFTGCNAISGTGAKRNITINDILEGEKISWAKISPSGKYLLVEYTEVKAGNGKNKKYHQILDIEKNKSLAIIRNSNVSNIKWLPKSDKISYLSEFETGQELFLYDLHQGTEKSLAENIKHLSDYTWSPNEEFIIYSDYIDNKFEGSLKRIFGSNDRLPYYRNRSFLHMIDLRTGKNSLLTAGYLSSNLHDIRPDGSKILFSTQGMDYTASPFSRQNLYEMDLKTNEITTIWENKPYPGFCQYSPDGASLLVQGGPECFDDLGVNLSDNKKPNNFDEQLYIFDLQTKNIDPITKQFGPSVESAYWANDNEIYITVLERDYKNLYGYSPKTRLFRKIQVNVEVINDMDFAYHTPWAVYSGTSISTPDKLFAIHLKKGTNKQIKFPGQEKFSNIEQEKTEEWNFVNKNGTTIYGRIYFPLNYDPLKKYPVIVHYYGGTSPVSRSFGGRYPISTWTACGYMVYLLQPSGAVGFGQDFSALHVNGWGFDAIDDIIEGTKKFLNAYPSADKENIGCIGASYGGYTTMLLQTRTDIFKTAISHAGISSITSYWGEGYWGYTYSSTATFNSYPWNRKDIYVENSPLYNADKFNNSILLLHGTDDTNVPVGESLQFYLALNILGKDVEMVLIDGQNHHILDYNKRIQWHHTIISWFDKKLKNQPQQWNDMYPDKNL